MNTPENNGTILNGEPREPETVSQNSIQSEAPNAAIRTDAQQAAVQNTTVRSTVNVAAAEPIHENIIAGIIGAFLFSLVGGILYFIVYQAGFIAGICGLFTVALAGLGYQLFSGKKNSLTGVIASIIMLIIIMALAEYTCVAYEIFKALKDDYEIGFFDAFRGVPTMLQEPELLTAFIKDLLISYVLGIIASVGYIRGALKARKESNQPTPAAEG